MSGFFSKLKDKAVSMSGIEDKAADGLKRLLASEGGNAVTEKIIAQFEKEGLGDKARSWVGPGPKQPLTTAEVQQVLTSDQVKFLANCTGLPLAPLLPIIAKMLPVIIEKMAKKEEGSDQAVEEALADLKSEH